MDFALTLWAAADPAMLETTSIWSTVAKVALNILLVILGINALIIVHEFGHFVVARLCGVRCDKFYIWFDFWGLKFFKFKWGDTEYGLGVFPLGGYVKMLGQEDNPGELKAEMERARAQQEAEKLQDDGNPNVQTIEQDALDKQPTRSIEELNEQIYSPDSYLAKSVPQRMAIIVAGVVMNFLFAIVCATTAYMVGLKEPAPVVGNVIPGSPAWSAGLQAGDRITAINDNPVRVFMDINMSMVDGDSGIKLAIDRPGEDGKVKQLEKTLVARKRKNDLSPSIGVVNTSSLELASAKTPVYPSVKKFYSEETLKTLQGTPDLKIVAVEGKQVWSYAMFMDEQLKKFDQPVECELADPIAYKLAPGTEIEPIKATLPAIPMREIGVRFKMGPVVSVLPGSDAEKKGIEVGNKIVSVDGARNFDPLKLSQIILRKLNEGKTTVDLGIVGPDPDKQHADQQHANQRESDELAKKNEAAVEIVTVELAPVRAIPNLGPLSMKDPVGSTALGLSWTVEPIIAGIDENASEAAKNLPVGAKVLAVKFINSEALLMETTFTEKDKEGYRFLHIGNKIDIPYIFNTLLQIAFSKEPSKKEVKAGTTKKEISIRLDLEDAEGKISTVDLPILESKDWFNTDRGLVLQAERSLVQIKNFGEALSMGTGKMIDCSLSVFKTIYALCSGGVSPKALGGPIMIVKGAYNFVERGMGSYLIFLCLIGANLAVLNILPIPVLDGGHLMFLLYEGIFRKPPNETVLVILSYIGLFLILLLMVWAVSLDLGCVKRF